MISVIIQFLILEKKNHILYDLEILDVKSKGFKIFGLVGLIISAPFIIFFLPILIYGTFALLWSNQLINKIAISYGFGEKDIYNYKLDKYLYGQINDNNLTEEQKKEKIQKISHDLFENLLYYIGPIQCLIKAKEQAEHVKNLLEELASRNDEDWNIFKLEKI